MIRLVPPYRQGIHAVLIVNSTGAFVRGFRIARLSSARATNTLIGAFRVSRSAAFLSDYLWQFTALALEAAQFCSALGGLNGSKITNADNHPRAAVIALRFREERTTTDVVRHAGRDVRYYYSSGLSPYVPPSFQVPHVHFSPIVSFTDWSYTLF